MGSRELLEVSLRQVSLISNFNEYVHPQTEVSLDVWLPVRFHELEQMTPGNATSCDELQWEFIAFYFAKNQSHRFPMPAVILPFTKEQHLGEGGFGRLSHLDINFDQQCFSNDANLSWVRLISIFTSYII